MDNNYWKNISETENIALFGAKAVNLANLIKLNLEVPNGICFQSDFFNLREKNKLEYDKIIFSILDQIENLVPSKNGWAVRSSATIEDSANKSYAGEFLTVIVNQKYELYRGIDRVLTEKNINIENKFDMGVIIQEFIEPDYSGVVFSCNPLTSVKESVVEVCTGRGDNLVSGNVTPWSYSSNMGWKEQKPEKIDEKIIQSICEISNAVANELGFEVDMEWAVKSGKLYWLQVRPITSISTIKEFLIQEDDMKKLSGEWFLLDQCLQPLIPLVESLDPSGIINSLNWKTNLINHYPYIQMKNTLNFNFPKEYLCGEILKEWECIEAKYGKLFDDALSNNLTNLSNSDLVKELNCRIINNKDFVNCYMDRRWMFVRRKSGQALRGYLGKIYNTNNDIERYLSILGSNLNTITSYKCKQINNLVELGIENFYMVPQNSHDLKVNSNKWISKFQDFINEFGYMSPCSTFFYLPTLKETPEIMLDIITNLINMNKVLDDINDEDWKKHMYTVKEQLPSHDRIDFEDQLKLFRECLIRTENDDYLLEKGTAQVRMNILEIGKRIYSKGFISNIEDIFFLNKNELENFQNNKLDYKNLNTKIEYRKIEFENAKKMAPPRMIVNGFGIDKQKYDDSIKTLVGTPASNGFTEGIAYIINNPLNIESYCNIPKNAIVIAEMITPGMTQNLIPSRAIITEVGGFLSHGAIWAREMKIPAIVGVDSALTRIVTGDRLLVDAVKGEIIIIK